MTDNQGTPSPDGIPELLNTIMSNTEVMDKISAIVGAPSEEDSSKSTANTATGPESILSDPSIMAKLPEVISVLRPMLGESHEKEHTKKSAPHAGDRRIALLCALKPYLSPRRCEAIDYITRISRLGDVMKNFKI